jgi:hypothetical protein
MLAVATLPFQQTALVSPKSTLCNLPYPLAHVMSTSIHL